ncbi:hypothetical protein LQZ19_00360 [Treponema primitia]|uniref:hypothetical protein n=1 Tax=Treponema primitia TaxID=88058 RepID=UPI0039814ABA
MDHLDKTIIGKPEPWLIAAAAEIDLDFSAFSHVLTNELKNHALKRHGDPAISGAAAIVPKD